MTFFLLKNTTNLLRLTSHTSQCTLFGVHLQEAEFIKWLTSQCRIRHYHSQEKNKVIEFIVQLEVKINEQWRSVVRYDTSHGFAHQDIYYTDGKIDKVPLGIGDYNMAMTFAENDLKRNWNLYVKPFLKEVE